MNEITPHAPMMSTKEIASLTGKQHKNVIRDANVMLEALQKDGSNLGHVEYQVVTDERNYTAEILLNKRLSHILVSGYSIPHRAKIVDRWLQLEAVVQSAQSGVSRTQPTTAIPATKEFRALYGLARMLGFDKNVAAIRSNQAAEEVTGVNVLRLLGSEHLESEQQSRWHTPTELGREINVTARQFNLMLADAGLQTRECGEWVPTDAADGLCRLLDTGKKHGSGTAVSQLKWSQDVLRRIGREAA